MVQGIDIDNLARPLQAAFVSAITFSVGAGIPLLAAAFIADWKVPADPSSKLLHVSWPHVPAAFVRLRLCIDCGGCAIWLQVRTAVVVVATTCGLAAFGSMAAWLGGANKLRAASRVLFGGWVAMALTYAIGLLFDS